MAKSLSKNGRRLFHITTYVPPWELSPANKTRGAAIAYETLNDTQIQNIRFIVREWLFGLLMLS